MDVNSATTNSGKTPAPYGRFVFSLACFTCAAASGTFLLARATAQGSPNAFTENSISILGLIGTATWAEQVWTEIARVEPKTDFAFRLKHRAFGLRAAVAIAAVLVIAAALGTHTGIRASHHAKLDMVTKQVYDLGAKTAPTKQRFIQAARRDSQNLSEYLARCTELETAINDYEPALQQMDSLMSQSEHELEALKSDVELAKLLPIVTVMRSVLSKDLEAARTYRKEIEFARQLPGLPGSDRVRFYDSKIQPLVDEVARIAKDEVEILKAAKARGVKLPQSMYSEAGIN